MEAVLKMLGLSPEKVKQQLEEVHGKVNKVIEHFDDRADELNRKLDKIMNHLNIKE